MTSALEASITLEEVFGVVTSKRVPLAPELAGYLALELAEGAGSMPGELQPRQIYIGDEGTVAIVRRPSQNDASVDSAAPTARGAEASIRGILQRLLDASGSQTPGLSAVAKKSATVGVPALMSELEAALIPVNRAAGRRALARLAREAKRVTLGVGRNAAVPASRASSPSLAQASQPAQKAEAPKEDAHAESPRPPASSNFSAEEIPTTAKREVALEVLSAADQPAANQPEQSSLPPTTRAATGGLVIKSSPVALQRPPSVNELPTVELSRMNMKPPTPRDSVDSLLSSFEVSEGQEKAVSRDLKAIAGLDPTLTPPPVGHAAHGEDPADSGLDSLLAMTESGRSPSAPTLPPPGQPASLPPPSLPPPRAPLRSAPQSRPSISDAAPPMRAMSPSFADDRSMPTAPKLTRSVSPPAKGRGIDRVLIGLFFILLVGGAVMVWMLKPGFFTGRTPEKVEEEKRAAEAASAKAADLAAKSHQCKESVALTDVPPKAEVLLRVGQAPVDIEHMPMAVRLEFVATLDGYASKRLVVLPDSTWDKGQDGKPRLESAIQLDPLAKHHGKTAVDAWPVAEAGSDVGGKGDPGTLHIISAPKGAEVWMVAGGGPEAQIDEIPCGDVDILLGGPGPFKKKIHVRAADFAPGDPAPNGDTIKIAHISAK